MIRIPDTWRRGKGLANSHPPAEASARGVFATADAHACFSGGQSESSLLECSNSGCTASTLSRFASSCWGGVGNPVSFVGHERKAAAKCTNDSANKHRRRQSIASRHSPVTTTSTTETAPTGTVTTVVQPKKASTATLICRGSSVRGTFSSSSAAVFFPKLAGGDSASPLTPPPTAAGPTSRKRKTLGATDDARITIKRSHGDGNKDMHGSTGARVSSSIDVHGDNNLEEEEDQGEEDVEGWNEMDVGEDGFPDMRVVEGSKRKRGTSGRRKLGSVGAIGRGKKGKRPLKKGKGKGSDQQPEDDGSLEDHAGISLFGMGLLNRLEVQANNRRKALLGRNNQPRRGKKARKEEITRSPGEFLRVTSSGEGSSDCDADEDGASNSMNHFGTSISASHAAAGHRQTPKETTQNQSQRAFEASSTRFALDDSCIYNFKEKQSSTCFPRQSASEACQLIIDAINKCNLHDAKKKQAASTMEQISAAQRSPLDQHTPEVTTGGQQQGGQTVIPSTRSDVEVPSVAAEVNLDHILSSVPYRDMLKDFFGSSCSSLHTNRSHHRAGAQPQQLHQQQARLPQIPIVTKSYEESFMREPMWDYERPCVMGSSCECNFISTRPEESFTGVEFILPSEAHLDVSERQQRQMCVLCHRKLVQSLFYDIMYSGAPFRGVIQRYGNICNHAGEFFCKFVDEDIAAKCF